MGDTEIGDLDLSVWSNNNIAWFDIPVNDPFLMGIFEGSGDLCPEFNHFFCIEVFVANEVGE